MFSEATLRSSGNISCPLLNCKKDYVGIFISNMKYQSILSHLSCSFFINSLHFAIIREFHICHSFPRHDSFTLPASSSKQRRFFLYSASYIP
ncbi:hypothetical protein CW304_16790 [Bacillus sp. UFRGS-B20]|nr:hypothetical protein CW304_16790 [Bacillus sp. UFRGS-B20]